MDNALTISVSGAKAYIARITGKDTKYGLAREFLGTSACIDTAGLYEISSPKETKYMIAWMLDGRMVSCSIDESQAKQWCESTDLTSKAVACAIASMASALSNAQGKAAKQGMDGLARVSASMSRLTGATDLCTYGCYIAALESTIGRLSAPDNRASIIRARLAELAAEQAALTAELESLT